MVGVIKAPTTQEALKRVWAWRFAVDRWEVWGTWEFCKEDLQEVCEVVAPHNVSVVTWDVPSYEDARCASAYGATGWISYRKYDELQGFLLHDDTPDNYRAQMAGCGVDLTWRFDGSDFNDAADLIAACQLLHERVGIAAQPYWTKPMRGLSSERAIALAKVCTTPPTVIIRAAEGLPFRCQNLNVPHFQGAAVTGCPFRDLPGSGEDTIAGAAGVLLAEAKSCQTGCYNPHPLLDSRYLVDEDILVETWHYEVVEASGRGLPPVVQKEGDAPW